MQVTGGDEIIAILSVLAWISFALGFTYFLCRTCFNWRYAGSLFGFLGLTYLIFNFFKVVGQPKASIFETNCQTFPGNIYDCGGWLFTHKAAYEVAQSAQSYLISTDVAAGQALIAGFVVVALMLSEYSQAVLKGGIKALVGVAVTVMGSYFVFSHLSDIQGIANRAVDMTLSFGRYSPEESYAKLSDYFKIFDDLEMKFSALDILSVKKTLVNNLALGASFLYRIMYGLLSWANLVMFLFQTLGLVFVPSMTAVAFINFQLSGPKATLKPVMFIMAAVLGRFFVVIQMACINQIDITPDFGTLAAADFSQIFDFVISFLFVMVSLISSVFTMLFFVFKLIWTQIFQPKVQALI